MKKLVLFSKKSKVDKTLQSILVENFDSQFSTTESGNDIWGTLTETNPDIILIMSDAATDNDYSLLKAIQSKKTLLPSSVIVVTPKTPSDKEFKCLDYGTGLYQCPLQQAANRQPT